MERVTLALQLDVISVLFFCKKNLLAAMHLRYSSAPLVYRRASVASETIRGVTQLKIGDVC